MVIAFLILISGVFGIVKAQTTCSLKGCVHDGGDVVLIFSLANEDSSAVGCELRKGGINSTHVEATDGRIYTDLSCYVRSRCVSGEKESKEFYIPAGKDDLLSMVVKDVPKGVNEFKKVSLALNYEGGGRQIFDFEKVPVMAELSAKIIKK
ncbi:MAG: hypothetical protein K2N03_05945 [Muribaculaceae bacterium]|nr:hypothetical protein [Muribaculaceae bacterium]